MDFLAAVERFLNNQSVGAFLGAFAAFGLVMLTDRRRDLKKVRNLRAEVEVNSAHARGKLDTVRSTRSLLRDHSRVVPAPILRFNSVLIQHLATEVLDRLTIDERRAIEALCYTMEAIDGLLDEACSEAKRLSFNALSGDEQKVASERLMGTYEDAIVNLNRLVEMCEHYVNQRYVIMLNKQYDRLDYEEE